MIKEISDSKLLCKEAKQFLVKVLAWDLNDRPTAHDLQDFDILL